MFPLILLHAYSSVNCSYDGGTLTFYGIGVLKKANVISCLNEIPGTEIITKLEIKGGVYDIDYCTFYTFDQFKFVTHIVLEGVKTLGDENFDDRFSMVETFEFDSSLNTIQKCLSTHIGVFDIDLGDHVTNIKPSVLLVMKSVKVGKNNSNYEENDGSNRYILNKGGKTIYGIVNGLEDLDLVYPDSVDRATIFYYDGVYKVNSVDFNNVEIIDSTFDNGLLTSTNFVIKRMDKVRIIEANAFKHCSNATITLPSTLEYIDPTAIKDNVEIFISDCPNYQILDAGVKLLVQSPNKEIIKISSMDANSNLTIDGYSIPKSFFSNRAFDDITIKNVKLIPSYCFQGASMNSLTIGPGVDEIGSYAFDRITSTNHISVTLDNSVRSIHECCFKNAKMNINGIPSSLEYLGASSFEGVDSSNSHDLAIPAGCTQILSNTFKNWTNLKSLTFQNGFLFLDSTSIIGTGITSLSFPSIQSFGALPSSFGSISIQGIYSDDSVFFYNQDNSSLIFCDNNGLNDDQTIDFAGVKTLGLNIFKSLTKTVTLTFPDLIKISDSAFSNSQIKKLVFGSKCQYIGNNCFQNCTIDELIFEASEFLEIGQNIFMSGLTVKNLIIPPIVLNNGLVKLEKSSNTLSYTINDVHIGIEEIDGKSICTFNDEEVSIEMFQYSCDKILFKDKVKYIDDISTVYQPASTHIEIDCFPETFPNIFTSAFIANLKISSSLDSLDVLRNPKASSTTLEFGPNSVLQKLNDKILTKDGKTLVLCFSTDNGKDLSNLPNTVTDIASDAFILLSSATITIPSHVTTLKEGSISGPLSFILNEGLKTIEYNTFDKVTLFNIPSSVESIGCSEIGMMIADGTLTIADGCKAFTVKDNVLYSSDLKAAYDVINKSVSSLIVNLSMFTR